MSTTRRIEIGNNVILTNDPKKTRYVVTEKRITSEMQQETEEERPLSAEELLSPTGRSPVKKYIIKFDIKSKKDGNTISGVSKELLTLNEEPDPETADVSEPDPETAADVSAKPADVSAKPAVVEQHRNRKVSKSTKPLSSGGRKRNSKKYRSNKKKHSRKRRNKTIRRKN